MLKNKLIAGFILHDPIGNTEGYIEDATQDQLKEAQDNGCVLLVQYVDGDRQVIQPEDVDLSLINMSGSVNVMEQEFTVPILNAILEVLEESYSPQVAVMSTASRKTNKLDSLKSLMNDMNERYLPNIEGNE